MLPIKDESEGSQFTPVNLVIIGVNVAIFILSLPSLKSFVGSFGLIPAEFFSGRKLYTIFTSMFLHGGFAHLGGNMWFLFVFGDNVERDLGKVRYLGLYFASGIFAAFLFGLLNVGSSIPLVGASGAISGVLGYYLVRFTENRVLVWFRFIVRWVSAKWYIGFWFTLQLFLSGFGGGGVAYLAHVSGFVVGIVVGFWIKSTPQGGKDI